MEREIRRVKPDSKCMKAACFIVEMLKYQCQGFILPPSEAKHLLGISPTDRAWHLHERIEMLRRELARRYVAMEVNPIQGIMVQLYRLPPAFGIPFSPRFLRQ